MPQSSCREVTSKVPPDRMPASAGTSPALRLGGLAGLAMIAAIAVLVFLCSASYTCRSTVVGQLVPVQGMLTVTAPADGVVAWLNVAEGGRVRAGGSLALVSMSRATVDVGDAQGAIDAHLSERERGLEEERLAGHGRMQAQRQGLIRRLYRARDELQLVQAEVQVRQQQVRTAADRLQRLHRLEEGRYVGQLQLQQQEAVLLDHTAQWRSLQRQASGARRLIARLQQELDEMPAQARANDAGHARAQARLEQERLQADAADGLLVKAAVAGTVGIHLVKPGQAVRANQPLLVLLPGDGRLEAELRVPSRVIGFIAPGDDVLLRYRAFPYQKFGHQRGRVERISLSALPDDAAGRGGEAAYRITVSLARQHVVAYGKPEPLRPGMPLEADIMGERRRLFEWLFEPLLGMSARWEG